MDAQNIFNTALHAIIRQNAPAMRDDGSGCAYRAPDGNRCAVGWLLTDEMYRPSMEGQAICNNLELHPKLLAPLKPHMRLLGDMQEAHDNASEDLDKARRDGSRTQFKTFFRARMRRVAREHGLRYVEFKDHDLIIPSSAPATSPSPAPRRVTQS